MKIIIDITKLFFPVHQRFLSDKTEKHAVILGLSQHKRLHFSSVCYAQTCVLSHEVLGLCNQGLKTQGTA